MICYILDDQYGKKIYQWLAQWSNCIFPIQDNILNPLHYIDEIQDNNPDYIFLDNYFPNRTWWREEPLGNELLQRLLQSWLTSKVICISDYGKRLVDEYDGWKQWYEQWMVVDFVPSKDPKDLMKMLR